MRYYLTFILFCLIVSTSIFAQKIVLPTQAKEDFNIFKHILEQGHPSLYTYIDSDSLALIFDEVERSLTHSHTDVQLFKKLTDVTNSIKDGNLQVFPSPSQHQSEHFFPLTIKIINTYFYTDTHDFGIPVGSKITHINGEKSETILAHLKRYVPADGYNITKKHRHIETHFSRYYNYEYGTHNYFNVHYTTPDGTQKCIDLDAVSATHVTYQNNKRHSYFAAYHHKKNDISFFESYIHPKTPFVYYKNKVAILVVPSFQMEHTSFSSILKRLFTEIKKKKTKQLIIDVRYNQRGFRANVIDLYAYISRTHFKEIKNTVVGALSIPERQYTTGVFMEDELFLKERFVQHPQYDSWKLDFDDLETMMIPHQNRFKGMVYVLTSGNTCLAGSTFALHIKNDLHALLIGEETGSGYYSHNEGFTVHYTLPNSDINIVLPMEKIEHYITNPSIPKGLGIPPDRYVPLTLPDLIKGKDAPLDYALKLIKG